MCACGERRGEEEGKGNGIGFLFFAGMNLRGGLRGGFQQNIHQFSRCSLSGLQFPLIGQCQGRGSLVIAASPGLAHLVLLLFWAWSRNTTDA